MLLTVVIPTYNKRALLGRVLDGLKPQVPAVRGGAEVVVIDDGSTDGTAEMLAERQARGELRFYTQKNQGVSAARNHGADRARGKIILLLDHDMVPEPGLLQAHVDAHASGDRWVGVHGLTLWPPHNRLWTHFYRLLNEGGLFFGYRWIFDEDDLPYWSFYGCNTSLWKTTFQAYGGFDPGFPWSWEDIEFGYRMMVAGQPGLPRLRLVLERRARASHIRPFTSKTYFQRQYAVGAPGLVIMRKHPELAMALHPHFVSFPGEPMPWRLRLFQALARLGDFVPLPLPFQLYDAVGCWWRGRGIGESLLKRQAAELLAREPG